MPEKSITPFANNSDAMVVADLNIENGTDKIIIYGTLDIAKDQTGLRNALALKTLLDKVVDVLKAEKLPEKLTVPESIPSTIKNPFAND